MNRLLKPALALGALLAAVVAAYAIQPGTTGTEKRFQQEALRAYVLTLPTKTATATGTQPLLVATLNAAGAGVVTSPSITTPADSEVSLTLTNSMIEAGDVVLASAGLGTSTVGKIYVAEVKEATGSVLIRVRNASGASTLNGTIRIKFLVIKQSALGAD